MITDSAVFGHATSQFNLGVIYHCGEGIVELDFDTARYWLTRAVENGDDEAQEYLREWFG